MSRGFAQIPVIIVLVLLSLSLPLLSTYVSTHNTENRSRATTDDVRNQSSYGTSPPPCTINISCGADTPIGSYCYDSCGNKIPGRKPLISPTPIPGYTCTGSNQCFGATCSQLGKQTGLGTCPISQFCCGASIPLTATPTTCTRDISCGADTYIGSTCTDRCNNIIPGRKSIIVPTNVPGVTCTGSCFGMSCSQLGKQSGVGTCPNSQFCCGASIPLTATPQPSSTPRPTLGILTLPNLVSPAPTLSPFAFPYSPGATQPAPGISASTVDGGTKYAGTSDQFSPYAQYGKFSASDADATCHIWEAEQGLCKLTAIDVMIDTLMVVDAAAVVSAGVVFAPYVAPLAYTYGSTVLASAGALGAAARLATNSYVQTAVQGLGYAGALAVCQNNWYSTECAAGMAGMNELGGIKSLAETAVATPLLRSAYSGAVTGIQSTAQTFSRYVNQRIGSNLNNTKVNTSLYDSMFDDYGLERPPPRSVGDGVAEKLPATPPVPIDTNKGPLYLSADKLQRYDDATIRDYLRIYGHIDESGLRSSDLPVEIFASQIDYQANETALKLRQTLLTTIDDSLYPQNLIRPNVGPLARQYKVDPSLTMKDARFRQSFAMLKKLADQEGATSIEEIALLEQKLFPSNHIDAAQNAAKRLTDISGGQISVKINNIDDDFNVGLADKLVEDARNTQSLSLGDFMDPNRVKNGNVCFHDCVLTQSVATARGLQSDLMSLSLYIPGNPGQRGHVVLQYTQNGQVMITDPRNGITLPADEYQRMFASYLKASSVRVENQGSYFLPK